VKSLLPILILLSAAALYAADDEGFKRYQLILDKQPFGQEPPEADVVQVSLNESFARDLRLSMLFEGPDGDVRVGIINIASKKSYILRIGAEEDGLELVEADLRASEALLRKGNEVALFKLEASAPEPLSKGQQAARKSSYTDRRRGRIEAPQPEPPAEPPPQTILTGEALRLHLENVQMDAIRNGLPPLPLPLTPEMDAQLVREGVLPPQ
jgi:hypothetical protein